jgi:DNA-binding MarR family transcriptional regulator
MSPSDSLSEALHTWTRTFMRQSMTRFSRYARDSGISMQQLGVLIYLQRTGHCGISKIGSDLGVSNAAASQMIERLLQQGFLQRKEDPNDRRVRNVLLTEKGRQLVDESIQIRHGWLDELAQWLTPGQQADIITALDLLTQAAQQLGDMEPIRQDC